MGDVPAARAELLRVFHAACARTDAGMLAARALAGVPRSACVAALGKVAHRMMRAVLAERPDLRPLVSVGTEAGSERWALAGDHPVPGERSTAAGKALLDAVRHADGEPILVLLSGGGSALAEAPHPGIDAEELAEATRVLLRSGLDIVQLNEVRKRLSAIKAGGLARAASRSAWTVLALSDVAGDRLDAIASGPCSPDATAPQAAARHCRRAGVWDALPASVRERLSWSEPAPSLAGIRVEARILAGARDLARAAAAELKIPVTVDPPVDGPVDARAERYQRWARTHAGRGPAALVAAGETTLRVAGGGTGGRAQHLALMVAGAISGLDAAFLAAGSDGRDGATEHAGALVDGTTAARAGADLLRALRGFDSAPLLARLGDAMAREPPKTHLGELHLLMLGR